MEEEDVHMLLVSRIKINSLDIADVKMSKYVIHM